MLACIGVDVGGTNTDAVILCGHRVVSYVKKPTTRDVITGVRRAVNVVLSDAKKTEPYLSIIQVNIGTTHFVNAVVQRRDLARVSVIRLCGPSTRDLPPYGDFPQDLAQVVQGEVYTINGGFQYDGQEITPLNEDEVRECIRHSQQKGIRNFVVSGVFAPVDPSQEEKACDIILADFPDVSLTLSHLVGHIGIIERENAAILNECLKPLSNRTIEGFRTALHELGLNCPFYLTQNDGTIISSEEATRFPVTTFASGPTNSMRGASFLSDVPDCIVVDIGGTTCDVGALIKGFPREASTQVKVGDVQTNFRMPDVFSIGLGGGSLVNITGTGATKKVTVGPASTGYRLMEEGLAFGGETFTTTDAAVRLGMVEFGDHDLVKGRVQLDEAEAVISKIRDMLEDCVDQMKPSKADMVVILVGGGSVLVDQEKTILKGVKQLIKPPYFDVANAIGAALSQIGGTVDYVVSLTSLIGEQRFSDAIKSAEEGILEQNSKDKMSVAVEKLKRELFSEAKVTARKQAVERATTIAVGFGAKQSTIQLVEVSDISLSYIPGNACRVKVKVIGELYQEALGDSAMPLDSISLKEGKWDTAKPEEYEKDVQVATATGQKLSEDEVVKGLINPYTYQPDVDPSTGEWNITEYDTECITIGAGILGCGGGGSPYQGKVLVQLKLKEGKKIRVISASRYEKIADPETEVAVHVAFLGAPIIMAEKPMSANETKNAVQAFEVLLNAPDDGQAYLESYGCTVSKSENITTCDHMVSNISSKDKPKKRITALISAEIGGLNSVEPLILAADMNLPVIDCDGMGRAFPEIQMFTPLIFGSNPYPAVVADEFGRTAGVLRANTAKDLENYLRVVCTEMGCTAGLALVDLRPGEIIRKTVSGSLSRAWHLGLAVLQARFDKTSPITTILNKENGKLLIKGKIIELNRETKGGFNRGEATVQGLGEDSGKLLKIDFQNEFLIARSVEPSQVLACTPDLITFVDLDSGEPIPGEEARFGLRVAVLALPSQPEMATPAGLKVVGPQAFGYDDVTYKPIGECSSFNCIPK